MALRGILSGRCGTTLHPRGRRGTHGTPWRAWVWFGRALVARDAAAFCVAGVAQPYIHLRFTWQAWHNLTSTFVSRGMQAWHSRHSAAFCVAGVAQRYIHLRFTWQVWHNLTSTFVSRGRRGTISHPPSFRVAGVALMALRGALGSGLGAPWSRVTPRHFAWQPWHNVTSTFVSRGRRGTHVTSTFVSRGRRGRRGTHGTPWRAWVCFRRGNIRAWWNSKKAEQLTHKQLTLHTYIHTCIHTYIHAPSFTHNCFNFSILHHILCLSFLPRPRYNL